mmetsp:Transcript_31682/g.73478  ORF Transcript_31682/g.73478 Transcript_31682/m.73478 type:complete len:304 (-) Transcript_31682:3-914(-)
MWSRTRSTLGLPWKVRGMSLEIKRAHSAKPSWFPAPGAGARSTPRSVSLTCETAAKLCLVGATAGIMEEAGTCCSLQLAGRSWRHLAALSAGVTSLANSRSLCWMELNLRLNGEDELQLCSEVVSCPSDVVLASRESSECEGESPPGPGKRLYEALNGSTCVSGVSAKNLHNGCATCSCRHAGSVSKCRSHVSKAARRRSSFTPVQLKKCFGGKGAPGRLSSMSPSSPRSSMKSEYRRSIDQGSLPPASVTSTQKRVTLSVHTVRSAGMVTCGGPNRYRARQSAGAIAKEEGLTRLSGSWRLH